MTFIKADTQHANSMAQKYVTSIPDGPDDQIYEFGMFPWMPDGLDLPDRLRYTWIHIPTIRKNDDVDRITHHLDQGCLIAQHDGTYRTRLRNTHSP